MSRNSRGVELPKGTPKTLDEALGFNQPDHELMNRSSSGPSTGAMRGVQFGTGSERETQHAHLHDFYRAVDRGVSRTSAFVPIPIDLGRSGRGNGDLPLRGNLSISVGARHSRKSGRWLMTRRNSAEGARHHLVRLPRADRGHIVRIKENLGTCPLLHQMIWIASCARLAEGRVSELYLDETGNGWEPSTARSSAASPIGTMKIS